MRHRRLPNHQTCPEGLQEPICPRKKCVIWARWRPVPVKTPITRGPPGVAVWSRRTPHYPSDSQLQVYDIYITRRVLFGCPRRDVNILIWTARKSVDHGTNDRVMVHGDGTRADGRRSVYFARISQIVGSRDRRVALSIVGILSNVVDAQAGYLARPTTKAPETQIYFITHRSGAFLVLRLRTVVRGERASRSIVNRTTALWSIWDGGVADTRSLGLGSSSM